MTKQELISNIKNKKSFLCVGLDVDIDKIPTHIKEMEDPIFEFNKRVIDATKDSCVAYKPNLAFYERLGVEGWTSLEKTIEYIPKDIMVIADAKRGDIGNTSKYYAQTFFEELKCDAVTVAPYMGSDSVTPFLEFENKWVILLALTSNKGALDFQSMKLENGKYLFEQVLETSASWGTTDNLMFVVGATRGTDIEKVRAVVPDHFFLVPGVGSQGGSLEEVVKYGFNQDCGLLVNSSRGIIYAGQGENFEEGVRNAAVELQQEMETLLIEKKFI